MADINKIGEDMEWNGKKLKKLIKRIRRQIPEDDCLSFQTRIGKISWAEVAFKSISPEECSEAWTQLLSKIRKFRLLNEILDDALSWTLSENVPNKTIVTKKKTVATEEAKVKHVTDEEDENEMTMQETVSVKGKAGRKPMSRVIIDSSEENACALYLKNQKVFKKTAAATVNAWKESWNALSLSEKKPWIQKAEKQELVKRDRLLGKSRPPTVPPNVNSYFLQQYLRNNPGIEPKLKFILGNQAWKSLDDESRNRVAEEWTNARREAYEGAREYLDSLEPIDREAEEKHYATAIPAKRKRAASVSVESKPAEISPKAAKRSRAKSVFATKAPTEEKMKELNNEERENRRSSKDAIRDRLKIRMRSTSEEADVDTDRDYSNAEEPVSPSKKVKKNKRGVEEISTSTRSMSPEFLSEDEVQADEPTSPVVAQKKSPIKKSPIKKNIFKLNTLRREKTPESEDFKSKSSKPNKSDKLRLKKSEESEAIDNIRVGGESQIDTTGEGEEEADRVAHKKSPTKKNIFKLNTLMREKTPELDDFKPKSSRSKKSDKLRLKKNLEGEAPIIDNLIVGGESQIDTSGEGEEEAAGETSIVFNTKVVKPKLRKQKKTAQDTDKGADPRRTMGETEFINHAGVTSSPKKPQLKNPSKEVAVNGVSGFGDGAPLMEPKAPPETAQQLYEMTSSKGESWADLADRNKRMFRDALRSLKKKYVSDYEAYLKTQPHHVLQEKAGHSN